MDFCVHCGYQNAEETNFCENCGKPINSVRETKSESNNSVGPQYSKQNGKKKPMSKKSKFTIIGIAVMIGLVVIANIVITKMLDPMKQIEAMDSALKQEDYRAFLEEFHIPEKSIYDAESFSLYVKENGWSAIRDNLIEEVNSLENGEFADPISDSHGTDLITVLQKKVLFGLFKKVEFKLVPIEVYTEAPLKDIEIMMNNHKVKTDIEGTQLLGQYLPGVYAWSYTYDGQWANLKNSGELAIRGNGSNKLKIDIDWEMTSLELDSDIEDAMVYVNGKSTKLTVSEIGEMYPLPANDSIEIYAVAKNSKGQEVQSNTITSDARYAYFEFPEDTNQPTIEEEQEKVTNGSQKDEYIQKLDSIDAGLADLEHLYTNKDNTEILKAEKETYTRWDNILNEIYALLKQQLSSGDMQSLKEVQIEWIKDKESSAKNAASKYAEDEMKEITKYKIEAQYTKERCYELVKNYMK
ncbi:TcaA 3rd/4th domain-containing protein [Lysinibacillus sphaericus]|uniref:TcaA 3rd/4th domain-containing protein n=1 Tax=Lysinibacillus sphaericus TaxID=1421 RepID=UPI0018CDB8EA|nr:lysozyme inhibitor LprI family protein [Lysinibacillus sphaericus]